MITITDRPRVNADIEFRRNPPEVMTFEEAARYLCVSQQTLRKIMDNHELPFKAISERCYRFSRSELDKWIRSEK